MPRTLERLASDRDRARRIFAAWLMIFALVGGEVAWAFRPSSAALPTASSLLPDSLNRVMGSALLSLLASLGVCTPFHLLSSKQGGD